MKRKIFPQSKRNQHKLKIVSNKDLRSDSQNSNDDFQNVKPDLENTDTMDILHTTIPTNSIPPQNTATKAKRKYVRKTTVPTPPTFTSENLETNRPPDTAPLDMQEPQRKQPHQQLVNDLAGLYATVGVLVSSFDMYDGIIVINKSVDRARELVNVAKHHPPMLKLLKQITKSNDYIAAISGHGLMVYALLAHHGRVPANMVLLQQTGYADVPIVQQQVEQLFEEAVPVPVETEEQQKQAAYEHYMQGQAQEIIHQDIADYEDAYVRSPLVYTVPDPRLGAYEVATPVGGDGQNRT